MLLSNVAGWVHVGCCHKTPDSSVAGHVSEPAAVSCCGHCYCDAGRQSEEAPGEDSAPQRESVPHDSESCHVCQNLFAFRHAILTSSPTAVRGSLTICRAQPELDDVSVDLVYLSGLSVRDPLPKPRPPQIPRTEGALLWQLSMLRPTSKDGCRV